MNPQLREPIRRSGRRPILLSWSGGKDSAWALHLLRQSLDYQVVALLTTINEKFRRVAIHGFREELLGLQAEAAGLPLWKIDLPFPCSNADYEARMAHVCARASAQGLHGIAFGDLFLEDIRAIASPAWPARASSPSSPSGVRTCVSPPPNSPAR